MLLQRTLAIFRKEFWHITRDARVLLLVTLTPAFLLLMLSYVFSFDVQHARLAVLDLDKSDLSREFVSRLIADDYFSLQTNLGDYAAAEPALLSGEANIALIIPHGFGDDLTSARPIELQALVDGMNPITARLGMAQLQARTRVFSLEKMARTGAAIQLTQANASADVRGRAWFNPGIKTIYSMVPGLLAIVLFVPAMAFTLALAREKETGSFEGLIATPVRGVEYLLGKLLAYVLAGLIGALIAILVAVYWFRVPFHGNFALLLALTALYFFASMSTGIVIADFVTSQQTAVAIYLLAFFMPSFFVTGLIQPINTSSIAGVLTSLPIPQTHFITIARGVFLKGLGWESLWQPALALGVIGCVMLSIGLALFKKKMS